MRISDWSSDVCSSDLLDPHLLHRPAGRGFIIFRRVQHRLRRDAADVEAGAAQRLAPLGAGGLQAKLRRADRRDIAAGAGTDDTDVIGICFVRHSKLRSPLACRRALLFFVRTPKKKNGASKNSTPPELYPPNKRHN